MTVNLFDNIAAMNVSSFIDQNMKYCAKSERLNYEMRFYLGSRKAPITAIVQSAVCRFQLKTRNLS